MDIFNEETKKQILDLQTKYAGKRIGFTCSAFDIFHCGHVLMLEDGKQYCDVLIVGLHTNPNIDRSSKNKPIQEYEEREIQIRGCKYVDEIIKYATESDLLQILYTLQPQVRILGTDWKDKSYTGCNIEQIKIHWHERTHNWSTSYLRERVYKAEVEKRS